MTLCVQHCVILGGPFTSIFRPRNNPAPQYHRVWGARLLLDSTWTMFLSSRRLFHMTTVSAWMIYSVVPFPANKHLNTATSWGVGRPLFDLTWTTLFVSFCRCFISTAFCQSGWFLVWSFFFSVKKHLQHRVHRNTLESGEWGVGSRSGQHYFSRDPVRVFLIYPLPFENAKHG